MFGFIPANVDDNTTIFYGNNIAAIISATTTLWQTWSKPAGVKFVRIMTIGSGGGGGGGAVQSGGSVAGGGGGGSGGISIVTIPAVFLPDTLYVFVAPMIPGLINTDGIGNNLSFTCVSTGPSSISRYRVCAAYSGEYGGSTVDGTGGIAGTGALVASISDMPLATSGKYELYAGVAGAVGGTAVGTSITPLSSFILSGGAGGAGKAGASSFAGGSQNASGILPLVSGGTSTSVNGGSGVWNWKPLCGTGGAGGYGSDGSIGGSGNGGNGAFGCGGGGGGADKDTARRGGAGGSGLVIISCW